MLRSQLHGQELVEEGISDLDPNTKNASEEQRARATGDMIALMCPTPV